MYAYEKFNDGKMENYTLTDEEIAANLHLSIWTVRKYVKQMLEKTQFKSRTQLAVAARESGLVIKGY